MSDPGPIHLMKYIVLQIPLIISTSCATHSDIGITCHREESDPTTNPPFVDEDTALSALADYHPNLVVWGVSPNETQSAFSLSMTRSSEAPKSVEYILEYGDHGCGYAPTGIVGLYLPMHMEISIGDRDVVGALEGGVEAFGSDLREMYFYGAGGNATLSEDWLTAAERDTDAELSWPPDSWGVSLTFGLIGAGVAVGASEGADEGLYWMGSLPSLQPDPAIPVLFEEDDTADPR